MKNNSLQVKKTFWVFSSERNKWSKGTKFMVLIVLDVAAVAAVVVVVAAAVVENANWIQQSLPKSSIHPELIIPAS